MGSLKNVLYMLSLSCFLSVPGIGWAEEPTYQMTEAELTELETIFDRLKTQQEQQTNLLREQSEQIKTLKIQLATSETQIKSSRNQLQEVETKLNAANQSLAAYAKEEKRTRARLERQRDTWAVFAAVTVGFALARR